MASIENSLKYDSEVEPVKVRLITTGEFVREYNHSAWCDTPRGAEEVPCESLNTQNKRNNSKKSIAEILCGLCIPWLNYNDVEAYHKTMRYIDVF